jgi:hypothetical protein
MEGSKLLDIFLRFIEFFESLLEGPMSYPLSPLCAFMTNTGLT